NGPFFGINDNEEFSPASLLKVPILITYLKLAETDPQLLGKKIRNDKRDDSNKGTAIPPSKAIEKGKTYTIEELLYMMIVYSDNNAHDLALANIDARLFNMPFIELGIEIPGVRKQEDFMSVKAYASFFRVLFNASYLSREMSEKALGYLTLVEFRKGLVAGVPSNVAVAHKFGERRLIGDNKDIKELHDCGIIYYPNHPYLLCVMTRGSDFGDLIDNVKDISYRVYEEVDHQHHNR
ncbi:MAG: serine hydrolase, partial [Thermodesulfovibrionales bacterium]|nr:serine hydrolase [Thermodesulfovibrionales bacterium]